MRAQTLLIAAAVLMSCGQDRDRYGAAWFVDEAADVLTIEDAVRASLSDPGGWEHESISDHGSERTELTFQPQGLRVFVDAYDLFWEEQPEVHVDATGTWSVDERGVVHIEWESGRWGFAEERTWAPMGPELAANLRQPDPHDRGAWPSTGYLAQDASLTVYHHRFWKQNGSYEQGGGEALLELSASPRELAGGAACSLRIEMDVTSRDSSGHEVFEFDCDIEEEAGFFRIRAVDLPADDATLSQWEDALEEQGIKDRYEYGVYAVFRDAAFPVLWFDPARPEVLVTDGYSESLSAFESSDHDIE